LEQWQVAATSFVYFVVKKLQKLVSGNGAHERARPIKVRGPSTIVFFPLFFAKANDWRL
jgi:hypothetical protein